MNSFVKFWLFFSILLGFFATAFAADAAVSTTIDTEVEATSSLMNDLDLNDMPFEWLSVQSGHSVAQPVRTSYGWANLTDGKMITAISENGAILWQKAIPANPDGFAAASKEDFLAVSLKNKKLTLLNPSGIVLWSEDIGFAPAANPFFGRDGRILVFGKENIVCFGVNGIRKWTMKTVAQDNSLPVVELDDGSIIFFAAAQENGKTVGIRISPFGEQLERIVFAGRVMNAFTVPDGALLAFGDGTLGLCAVDKTTQAAVSKWILKELALSSGVRFLNLDSAVLIAVVSPSVGGTKVHILNTKEAMVIRSFNVPEIKTINYITYSPDGIFIADNTSAVIYKITAVRIRGIKFPQNTKKDTYDYVLYGSNGVAVFVSRSWKLMGWKVLKSLPSKNVQKNYTTYKDFYENAPADYKRMYSATKISRKNTLQKGDYGASEKEFWKDANFVMTEYFMQKTSKNSAGDNKIGHEEIPFFTISDQTAVISMLGLFETQDAANSLARVLTLDKDETILRIALKSIQQCGYDPDYRIINALEAIIKRSGPKQELLIAESCETLYSVCRFMGRPALYKKGKQILSNLLLPQYSRQTKENARKVYEKLAELDL